MKVLASWLGEFAPFGDDAGALGDAMSDLGMTVESSWVVGGDLGDLMVARVAGLRAHPDADRIQLVDVDAGAGEMLQVCCGAFNLSEGDLVPLAPLGATLPGGLTIERRRMRGEWSEGMLCSAAELGMGDDQDGIWLLTGTGAIPGAPLADAVPTVGDVAWDLEINPNRPDAMSVAGVARDLAARMGLPFRLPDPQVPTAGTPAPERVSVRILDDELCGRFAIIVLDGVQVAPSPAWLASRLTAVGLRPVNNVVDISNYVMWELGQPNHAYDLGAVAGGAFGVRRARDGETVETLDGTVRALDAGDGVITDGNDVPIAVAGVMGGASTEIGPETTTVAVEFAWWDPDTVGRSSRRLGLRSEASLRFERGCDPEVIERAARRFAELAVATGATLAPGMVDVRGTTPVPARVAVRTARVNALLGTDLDSNRISGLLEPIGFGVTPIGAAGDLEVAVPSWRPDTTTEVDVTEEVARHLGYANIPLRRPNRSTTGSLSDRQLLRRRLRNLAVGVGASEAMPTPLLAPGDLESAGLGQLVDRALRLTNPLAAEESVLRPSLRPGLLRAVAYNVAHRNPAVRLFEVGRVFIADPAAATDGVLPLEPEHLAIVVAGEGAPEAVAILDVLADSLGVGLELTAGESEGLHPTRTARISRGGVEVGLVGEIDPFVVGALDLVGPVAWLELDLDALTAEPLPVHEYRAVSRFPSSDVDLAFEVGEEVPAASVRAAIVRAGGPLLVGVELFDVYRGTGVSPGTRSLAHRLRLQADDRTLTDADVAEVRQRVVDEVVSSLGATLRQ